MRLKLGLLQDPAAIDRQIARELKEVEKARQKAAVPTVKTEKEVKAEVKLLEEERKHVEEHVKSSIKPPRIRPLSEAKAIDSGANFIAETFLFFVAGGLILLEAWRRDRKDKKQDADVAQKLEEAEKEREEMKVQMALLKEEIDALLKKKPFDSAAARTKIEAANHALVLQRNEEKQKPKTEEHLVKVAEVANPTESDKSMEQPKKTLGSTKGTSLSEPSKSPARIPEAETPANGSSLLAYLPSSLWGGGNGSNPPSSKH